MKIFVLNYEYPPIGGGGGRACADLCKELASRGHDLRLLTTWMPGLERHETIDGYEVQRIWTGRRSRFQATFWDMAGYIIFGLFPALMTIRRWQPDLVHVHFGVPTGVLALVVHLLTGVEYVLTAHLGDVRGGVPDKTEDWFRLVDPLTPPIWNQASAVVAVSNYTKALIQDRYRLSPEVIPNGIEITEKEAGFTHNPPRLVFAGRFQPQKNLTFLFEALSELKDVDWNLWMVGDGPLRAKLETMAEGFDINRRVDFLGWVSPGEVEDLLDESDVLVMPSRSEGLPVVAVQALAHGLAMAVTEAGGLTDVVDDGVNGFKVPVGAEHEYVAGLRRLLANPQTIAVMKRNSLEKAKEFSLDSVAAAYEEVFKQAIG